jgi:hypothetical protein
MAAKNEKPLERRGPKRALVGVSYGDDRSEKRGTQRPQPRGAAKRIASLALLLMLAVAPSTSVSVDGGSVIQLALEPGETPTMGSWARGNPTAEQTPPNPTPVQPAAGTTTGQPSGGTSHPGADDPMSAPR